MTTENTSPLAFVINDDLTQLTLLAGLLRKDGLEVQTFASAEAALAALGQHRAPDLIVTDLYMPGIDGWRFCRLLRSADYAACNHIPILVVSATFAGEETSRIAADLGANGFLPSPVEGRRFLAMVRALLAGEQPREQLRVLIVEDSATQAKLFRNIFVDHGYHADIAQNVAEAVEAFSSCTYDLAVLDYYLPDGNGGQLLDRFQKVRPECVCVIITVGTDPELSLDMMKRGAAAFLRKPFAPSYLIEICIRARRERTLLRVEDLLEARTRELRASEERFRIIARNAFDLVALLDDQGRYVFCNEAYRNILGYDPDEMVGRSCFDLIHPDQREGARQFLRESVAGNLKSAQFLLTILHRDGRELLVEYHGQLIADGQGNRRILLNARNVTEQRRAEEALQASERKYHGLFSLLRLMADTMPDMLWAKNLKGEYIFANKALCQHLLNARDTSEPIGRSDIFFAERERLAHPENPQWHTFGELCMDSDAATLEALGEMQFEEFGNIKGVSLVLDVHKAPLLNNEGELIGVVGSGRDITERKRAEAERERLALAIEQTNEAIVITDTEGVILYVNPAFEWVTGYSREEAMGQNPRILKSGAHDETFYREMWATLKNGSAWQGRISNRKKDGTHFIEESVISPVRDAAGNTVNYVAVKRDITEQIQLEEQLRQSQKMESIGRLAGGVAHDFNNMLGVILGRAELALERMLPDSPLRCDLEDIRKAAERSAELTRQLLAFARKQTVTPKILDLNETVTDMLKMVRRLLGEHIEVVWRPGTDLWPVRIDPSQVDQIMANLCVNARDAMDKNGSITIATANRRLAESGQIDAPDLQPGEYVCLTVSDNGCGMDRETLRHIFEPFFTTKGVGEGTGLGLSTVYGVVVQNSGHITVESEPGRGTTFTIHLPRHQMKGQAETGDSQATRTVHGHETVLLVEDEPLILEMTKDMLEFHGYNVLAVGSAGDALRLAQTHPGRIDLLLTDVVMPEMNGRDLAKNLLSFYPNLKRLFMSGYTADVIAQHGVLSEGVHFIQKPFVSKELIAKVKEVLAAL